MRSTAATVLAACLTATAPRVAHADLSASAGRADDWGQVTVALTISMEGTQSLLFALYSSGRALYRAPSGRSVERYDVVTLRPDEQKALVGDLGLDQVGNLHPPRRMGFDGATECIVVWSNGTDKRDCIWGGIEDDDIQQRSDAQRTPPAMVKIWKRLTAFKSPRGKPWVPDRIGVVARPYAEWNCGAAEPWSWPNGWPHPPAEFRAQVKSVPGKPEPTWTFTVPGSALPEIERRASGLTERRLRTTLDRRR